MVRLSSDIEGASKEINNNKNTSFLKLLRDIYNQAVASLAVPLCLYFNKVIASLNRLVLPIGRICDKVERGVYGEEAVLIMMPGSTFRFTIAALLAFTEIKSQWYDGFPFRTHPTAIMVSVNSVVFYGFASVAELIISSAGFDRNSVYAIIVRLGRMASLCSLVVSLAVLFYF